MARRSTFTSKSSAAAMPPSPSVCSPITLACVTPLHAPVTSLALLADPSPTWRPASFSYDLLGHHISTSFPAVKLLDYGTSIQTLTRSANPVALIAAAHLHTQQTRRNPERRFALKSSLVEHLFARNWPLDRTLELYRVIDWLMRLPPPLQTTIFQQCNDHIRRRQMPFENSLINYWKSEARREGHAEGLATGIVEGRAEGWVEGTSEGRIEGQRRMLLAMLEHRFGRLPTEVYERVAAAGQRQLDAWGLALLEAGSIGELFGWPAPQDADQETKAASQPHNGRRHIKGSDGDL
ncbi:MAG TPA: DUF4351 domain-containing protein [Pseudoduganella sp.]